VSQTEEGGESGSVGIDYYFFSMNLVQPFFRNTDQIVIDNFMQTQQK
jgi:hypothetical protein